MILEPFATGVLFGGFGLLVGALAAFVTKRRGRAGGGLGVWIAAAALAAVELTSDLARLVPWVAVAGVALLVVGGWAFDRAPRPYSLAAFAPGATVLALTPMPGLDGATRIALGLLVAVAALAAADFEREHATDGFALWLLPVSALVPALLIDGGNEPGSAFAGAVAVIVVNAVPRPRARLGAPGIAAIVGAYLWVGTLLSANRAVRLATLLAGLGFLVLEPIARNLSRLEAKGRRRTGKRLQDSEALVIATAVFGQAIIDLFAIRVTGHSRRSEYALLALLPVLVVFTVTARAFVPAPRRRRASRSSSGSGRSRRGRHQPQWLRMVRRAGGAPTSHRSRRSSRHRDGRSGV